GQGGVGAERSSGTVVLHASDGQHAERRALEPPGSGSAEVQDLTLHAHASDPTTCRFTPRRLATALSTLPTRTPRPSASASTADRERLRLSSMVAAAGIPKPSRRSTNACAS